MNHTMQLRFMSQDNKRLLWDIMVQNNIFNNISETYVTNVKQDFETCLLQMSTRINPQDSILDLNKQIILKMIEEVNKYTQTKPITSAEITTKKQEKFQKGLQSKQEEFNNLIQPPKPVVIDFSDKVDDEPIGSEMDIKLAQTIAWREKQLSQVLEKQDTTAANEWINGKGINLEETQKTNNNFIKIGSDTKIDERSIINVKKVNFADTLIERGPNAMQGAKELPLSTISFMDKLKKKDGNEPSHIINEEIASIKSEMGQIKEQNKLLLEKLDKIMEMLIK